MAIFYALGDALVGNEELRAKAACGKLQHFQNQVSQGIKTARLDFKFGVATAKNLIKPRTAPADGIIQPREIGIGKPLTVQLRHVYTGNKAKGFWGDKDMLVVSAMKSLATCDAAPRAINYLVRKTTNNRNFRTPDATDAGTPLICYSPALAQSSSVVTVEVRFQGFPKETFDTVAQAFNMAAGIPVFAPASAYLVAASVVTKLAGNIAKSLTSGTPALKRTEEITLVTPGSVTAAAGFALLIADDVPVSLLRDYRVNARGQLVRVDDEQRAYDGPHCYAVISLDGRANTDFEQFNPVAASAAQLDRFYNLTDGSSQVLDQLVEGSKLYQDLAFREKALNAKQRLRTLETQGVKKTVPEYREALAQYHAYVANIKNQDLKPRD
jgi:hypothetical protein